MAGLPVNFPSAMQGAGEVLYRIADAVELNALQRELVRFRVARHGRGGMTAVPAHRDPIETRAFEVAAQHTANARAWRRQSAGT